jgi:hypothetical protein
MKMKGEKKGREGRENQKKKKAKGGGERRSSKLGVVERVKRRGIYSEKWVDDFIHVHKTLSKFLITLH